MDLFFSRTRSPTNKPKACTSKGITTVLVYILLVLFSLSSLKNAESFGAQQHQGRRCIDVFSLADENATMMEKSNGIDKRDNLRQSKETAGARIPESLNRNRTAHSQNKCSAEVRNQPFNGHMKHFDKTRASASSQYGERRFHYQQHHVPFENKEQTMRNDSGPQLIDGIFNEFVPDEIADNLGIHTASSAIITAYCFIGFIVIIFTVLHFFFSSRDFRKSLVLLQNLLAFHIKGITVSIYCTRLCVILLYFAVICLFSVTAAKYKGFGDLKEFNRSNFTFNSLLLVKQSFLGALRLLFILLIYLFGGFIHALGKTEYWFQYLHNMIYCDKNSNFIV